MHNMGLLNDPFTLDNFQRYFKKLFWVKGNEGLDAKDILQKMANNLQLHFSFRTIANEFKLINSPYLPIIVRYKQSPELIEQLKHQGPSRDLLRKLQRYIVNMPLAAYKDLLNNQEIVEVHKGIYVQVRDELYDKRLGLLTEKAGHYAAEDLAI